MRVRMKATRLLLARKIASRKIWDHIGFLKANNLATLNLDFEFATKKRIGITWVP